MLNEELRQTYRTKLLAYYFKQQQYKDAEAVRRQVVNMDDNALENDYNRLKDELD